MKGFGRRYIKRFWGKFGVVHGGGFRWGSMGMLSLAGSGRCCGIAPLLRNSSPERQRVKEEREVRVQEL